ncbi:hypothetical protein DL98DRAFT_518949 [Cadophora sp. DSE1049]|nr:hypothetical protein DL98DRAFT_518949 [Cadophora sp. DSE1049]
MSSSILPPRSAAQQLPCHRPPPLTPQSLLPPPHPKPSPSSLYIPVFPAKSTPKNKTHHSQARLLIPAPSPQSITTITTDPNKEGCYHVSLSLLKLRHDRSSSTARKPWCIFAVSGDLFVREMWCAACRDGLVVQPVFLAGLASVAFSGLGGVSIDRLR